MRLRFLSAILIFLSAYAPLSIILAIQDFNFDDGKFDHFPLIALMLGVSVISCIVLWSSVRFLKSSAPPLRIINVSNRSGELVNYSIPYLVSFFVMDLGDLNLLISFGVFMALMFILTLKTHNIFVNPILACLGYNLYDVRYLDASGNEAEAFFLVKGPRLTRDSKCRIRELSEQLFLVTETDPEI